MSEEEFIKPMKYLAIAYGKEMGLEQIKVWYGLLKDYDIETFKKAIKIIINKNERFPSIAEIKKELNNLTIEDYSLDARNEWGIVLELSRNARRGEEEEQFKKHLKPKTYRICQRIGINNLTEDLGSDNKASYQKLFLNLYNGMTEYEEYKEVYEDNIKKIQTYKNMLLENMEEEV